MRPNKSFKPNRFAVGLTLALGDVPPVLSSTTIWSPIPNQKEIGREEAFLGRTDHRLPA